MNLTNEMIRERGLRALREELGQAGMIKFMRLFVGGTGDYTKERIPWAEAFDLDTLRRDVKQRAKSKKAKAKKVRALKD
jgi:hypothetical protein